MSDFIALQKRADEAMTMLRRDGYREAAEIMLELRRAAYEREEKLVRIHNMIARKIREESDR